MRMEQMRMGDNFAYLVIDDESGSCAVVDPSGGAARIAERIEQAGASLAFILLTHGHFDHVGGVDDLRQRAGRDARIVAHPGYRDGPDIGADHGEVISMGAVSFTVLHTPGHTPDGICIIAEDGSGSDSYLFTGDTLFVRECGRTDLAGSDPSAMYDSFTLLKGLDDELVVCPGHDYGPKPTSTLGEEKRENYTFEERTREAFIRFMREP
ncbi:hydroxyacylglutathione hydrolase family protein [Thermodesulfobacteriota bacterium]